MELVAITDAELVTVGGYRSVLFRYVIKYPFNKSLSIVSVFTPVGDTVYDISFGHEFEKDVEGADIFLAILSSLAIEAKTGAPSATTAAKGRAPDVRSVLQKSGSPTPGDASAGKADTQTADTQAAKTDAPAAKADAQAAVEADNAELRAKMERLRQKARDMLS